MLDVQKKFREGKAEVTASTAWLVVEWLKDHIPVNDKPYGPHMNARGIA